MRLRVRKGTNPRRPWLVLDGDIILGTFPTLVEAGDKARKWAIIQALKEAAA